MSGPAWWAGPGVLFLDEPTAGLGPASRIELWHFIDVLVADGATLLLTTQYLEEAERLANRIVVLNHGKVIAHGTVNELKNQFGGDVVEIAIADAGKLDQAALVAGNGPAVPSVDRARSRVSMPAEGGVKALIEAARQLDQAGIGVADISLCRPSLDDVFLWLTGRSVDAERTDHPGAGLSPGPDRLPAVNEAPVQAPPGEPVMSASGGMLRVIPPDRSEPPRITPWVAWGDILGISRRDLLHVVRTPRLLVFAVVQPVMFVLLFRYVFGGRSRYPTVTMSIT